MSERINIQAGCEGEQKKGPKLRLTLNHSGHSVFSFVVPLEVLTLSLQRGSTGGASFLAERIDEPAPS